MLVVGGVVVDVAGDVLLLDAADAVFEAGRAGDRPVSRERLGVTLIRHEAPVDVRLVGELDRDIRERVDLREQPRLGSVREVRVGEEEDGRAVLERDSRGLDRGVEAAAGRRRRDDRDRSLGVPPEEHSEQVGLLRLRRHSGRGAGTLDVEDQQR